MNYTTHYNTIQSNHSPRSVARLWVLNGLSLMDTIGNGEQKLKNSRIHFLYIHHIFEDEKAQLINLIEYLSKQHTFISYNEAIDKLLNNEVDKPYIVISSDDGFKNNIHAAEILNRYNIKACFFINPGLIGQTDYTFIKTHCETKLHLPPVEFMDWDDVELLLKQGHEIGSHNMYHSNMAKQSQHQVIDDLLESYDIIKKKTGTIKHFAFPYGRLSDFNEFARQKAFEIGYHSCSSAERGCHINHSHKLKPDELFIRREHIVLNWPLNHIRHFLIKAAKNASSITNLNPYVK